MASSAAKAVISSVPMIAGPAPPVFRFRPGMVGRGGPMRMILSLVRNCQLIAAAPFEITVKIASPSGTRVMTNATHIRVVMTLFLVRRQPAGSRRSGACDEVGCDGHQAPLIFR